MLVLQMHAWGKEFRGLEECQAHFPRAALPEKPRKARQDGDWMLKI